MKLNKTTGKTALCLACLSVAILCAQTTQSNQKAKKQSDSTNVKVHITMEKWKDDTVKSTMRPMTEEEKREFLKHFDLKTMKLK